MLSGEVQRDLARRKEHAVRLDRLAVRANRLGRLVRRNHNLLARAAAAARLAALALTLTAAAGLALLLVALALLRALALTLTATRALGTLLGTLHSLAAARTLHSFTQHFLNSWQILVCRHL